MLKHLSEMTSTLGPAVANHLWQSTLFAVAAGTLTLLLRKNRAQARYWLWMIASVKFLFPFRSWSFLGAIFRCHRNRRVRNLVSTS